MSKVQEAEAQHHEKILLGSMMNDNSQVVTVMRSAVRSAFFRVVKHRFIFEAIEKLHRAFTRIDVLTVSNVLTEKKQLAFCGGVEYLSQLAGYASDQAKAKSAGAIKQGVREAGGKVDA